MRELVFRDPNRGSVVIRSRQPGLPFDGSVGNFEVSGIPLKGNIPNSELQGFFSNHQDFDFIFIKGNEPFKPPFSFVIRGNKDTILPIQALNDRVFMSQWNSRQWIGEIEIGLESGDGNIIWHLRAEVIPHHLPYRKAKTFMVAELEAWIQGLSRSMDKPLFDSNSEPIPWYKPDHKKEIVEAKLIDKFLESLNNLGRVLEEGWSFSQKWQVLGQKIPEVHPKPLPNSKGRWWLPYKERTKDTPINRWLLFCLNNLLNSLSGEKNNGLVQEIKVFIHRHLKGIPLSSQVSAPPYLPLAYQRWHQTYLALTKISRSARIGTEKQSLKDLPQLYEYWAFLKLASMIGEITQANLRFQDLLLYDRGHNISRLSHGQQLHFTYQLPDGESTIDLWYQKEIATPLGKHKPDIWLEVKRKHFETPFIFLMEIKFQVKENGIRLEAPKEALNQLHRYRDVLKPFQYQTLAGPLAQKAWGGAVIFPFPNDEEDFKSHPQYLQLWEEGIGAIPLYPSSYANQNLMYDWLKEILSMPTEGFFEQMINYDKREQQHSIERFDIPLPIRTQADEGPGYWNASSREWVGDRVIPLYGKGDLPKISNLGALDAALRYQQLHLLWTPNYLGLRLWQETHKHDLLAAWAHNGLFCQIKGVRCRIVLKKWVQIHFLGSTLQIDPRVGAKEIVRQLIKSL